jgi:hypothetical protein
VSWGWQVSAFFAWSFCKQEKEVSFARSMVRSATDVPFWSLSLAQVFHKSQTKKSCGIKNEKKIISKQKFN